MYQLLSGWNMTPIKQEDPPVMSKFESEGNDYWS